MFDVTMREAQQYVEDCMFANNIPFIKGSPGIGKSAVMKAVAKKNMLELIDHRVSTSAPEDFSGLPDFFTNPQGERRAQFVPFGDLFPLEGDPLPKNKEGWLLFLDEMNSGTRMVQAASYKALLDRMTGQKHFHERLLIAAAGNKESDKAIVERLSTALKSRVVTINVRVDHTEFMEDVAFKYNWDARIIGYLGANGQDALMDFDPNSTEDNFCCPRTWEMVNNFLTVPGFEMGEKKQSLIAGTITSGVAVAFTRFCALMKDLITVEAVLADPKNARVPGSEGQKWLLVSQMFSKMNTENFGKMCDYVSRLDLAFRLLFFRGAMVKNNKLRAHPAFAGAAREVMEYLK